MRVRGCTRGSDLARHAQYGGYRPAGEHLKGRCFEIAQPAARLLKRVIATRIDYSQKKLVSSRLSGEHEGVLINNTQLTKAGQVMVDSSLIQKKVVHAGREFKPIKEGTKVFFHFVTKRCDDESILDDSRKMGKPMELVLGKKFKLEVWEAIIQTMSISEVSTFAVDKSLVASYPFVSKTLRDSLKPKEHRNHHCCGVSLQTEGIGYEDLNNLMKQPCDLEFTLELLSVEDEYKKEMWQLSEGEKIDLVPRLKEEGNELFRKGQNHEAADKYSEALGILEQLMLREKPGDEEWNVLNSQKLPLLLNFSQCRLNQGEFYTVIEHCSTVLASEPDNVKALYRRGKAHIGAWNPEEARKDLQRVVELQPNLAKSVSLELRRLDDEEKKRNAEDRAKLAGKMF